MKSLDNFGTSVQAGSVSAASLFCTWLSWGSGDVPDGQQLGGRTSRFWLTTSSKAGSPASAGHRKAAEYVANR